MESGEKVLKKTGSDVDQKGSNIHESATNKLRTSINHRCNINKNRLNIL